MPQWRSVTPWALETPSQFRLPPPPDYQKSTIFREAYNESMLVGRKISAFRTKEETMIGEFWYVRASLGSLRAEAYIDCETTGLNMIECILSTHTYKTGMRMSKCTPMS
jgi:hypothetical protein